MTDLATRRDQVRQRLLGRPKNSRALQREYTILTAAILAEQLQQKRNAMKHCAETNPELWDALTTRLRASGLPQPTESLWTEKDVSIAMTSLDIAEETIQETIDRLLLLFAPYPSQSSQ